VDVWAVPLERDDDKNVFGFFCRPVLSLVVFDTRRYSGQMVRPKKYARRIMVRFDEEILEDLQSVIAEREDRLDSLRIAVELATAVRSLDLCADLKVHLLAKTTVKDVCLRAIARAVDQGKTALAGDGPTTNGGRDESEGGDVPPSILAPVTPPCLPADDEWLPLAQPGGAGRRRIR
jgi:hypothetical protein